MNQQQQPAGEQEHPGVVPDPATARLEAERLVASGLAALSMAADRIGAPTRERGGAAAAGYDAIGDMLFGPAGHRQHRVANDSPECCQCPVCKLISAARSPSPGFAERLAAGVGTLAEGAARFMRTVAGPAEPVADPAPPAADPAADPAPPVTDPVAASGEPAAASAAGGPPATDPVVAAVADRREPAGYEPDVWALATAAGAGGPGDLGGRGPAGGAGAAR
jgi:hypothetical protein